MAALTEDRFTETQEIGINSVPVGGGVKIYAGSIVAANPGGAGGSAGAYAKPAADAATLKVTGLAVEQKDNTAGSDGALSIKILPLVIARFDAVETTRLNVGAVLYVVDDHTVGDAPGVNSIKAGVCWQRISATEVWLYMDPAASF